MFLGEYEHTLDEKGRLTIPSKFRHEFTNGLVVTRGLDKCLVIYTMQGWDAYVATLDQLPADKQSSRSFIRFIFSGADHLVPDKQGRILLPSRLREFAGLGGEVFIIGTNQRLEVWSPDRWQAIRDEVEKDAERIVEELPDVRF
jgi:MraZ protein